jgi:hypothetical protein
MNAHPLPYGRALRALPLLWQHMAAPFGREHLLGGEGGSQKPRVTPLPYPNAPRMPHGAANAVKEPLR